MIYEIKAPNHLRGEIDLPSSKSISNRALILHALSYSPELPSNLSDCDDTLVMLRAFESNGTCFDIGAAGTSMRFLTAFLAKIAGVWTLTGSERMKHRPIKVLVDALRTCGAKIEYLEEEGFPPLKITGRALKGGELTLPGNVSSQYISALLMIAPTMQEGLILHLSGTIISTPYIRMTLKMLEHYGIQSSWKKDEICIRPQNFQEASIHIESDWSGASYWYEVLSFIPESTSSILLKGLQKDSFQGDSRIAEFFEALGIHTEYVQEGVILTKKEFQNQVLQLDLTDQPDLAQTLVVTCVMKEIPFYFTGLQSLKIKETDRLLALKQELKKLGFVICDKNDSILYWEGERCESDENPLIETYDDHRMAMAFAPIAILNDSIRIHHPEVVSKSYPAFWKDLQTQGFEITKINE